MSLQGQRSRARCAPGSAGVSAWPCARSAGVHAAATASWPTDETRIFNFWCINHVILHDVQY